MDTIYAEGQRRYVESLSSLRPAVRRPDAEAAGRSHRRPLAGDRHRAEATLGHTPRSTVGTVTEIYDYFRILFARLGQPHCPECDIPIGTQTSDQIVDKLLAEPAGTKLYVMAPVEVAGRRAVRDAVGISCAATATSACGSTARRTRSTSRRRSTAAASTTVEVVVDRIVVRRRRPLADRRQHRERAGAGQGRACTWPIPDDDVPEAALAGDASTASTWPATSAAAASTAQRRTTSRSTARSAGARRAKAWARKSARTRRRCCAIRS